MARFLLPFLAASATALQVSTSAAAPSISTPINTPIVSQHFAIPINIDGCAQRSVKNSRATFPSLAPFTLPRLCMSRRRPVTLQLAPGDVPSTAAAAFLAEYG